jgi:hypothetical protein
MSSESIVQNGTASRKALEALRLFSTIQPNDKLRFHKTTDTFEIDRGGSNFARTFSNAFRKSGTENSVTNDEMFHKPIVLVFKIAKITAKIAELEGAYAGLRNLERTYANDPTKLASLKKTLEAVKETIDEAPIKLSATSLLKLSEALSRQAVSIFSEYAEYADVLLARSLVQQINVADRASLQVIFAAARNDGSRINVELKKIGRNLKLVPLESKAEVLDLTILSKLVYNVLQSVEEIDFQHHDISGYANWINKIREMVQAKGLSVYFQLKKDVNFITARPDTLPPSDFLWFYREPQPRTNITRLYFCPVNMIDIDRFIGVAGDIMITGRFVFMFKIDFTKNLKFERKDAIVLYFEGDMNTGRTLAAEFKTRLGHGYLKPNFGVFGSTSVSADNDVFWQPEPGLLDTGLSKYENRTDENIKNGKVKFDNHGNPLPRQHSASSIRADLITMALLKWKIDFEYQIAKCEENKLDKPDLHNDRTFEYEFELFKSYVARALDGYKLYLNPGFRS